MTLLCTPSPLPLCEPLSPPQSFLSACFPSMSTSSTAAGFSSSAKTLIVAHDEIGPLPQHQRPPGAPAAHRATQRATPAPSRTPCFPAGTKKEKSSSPATAAAPPTPCTWPRNSPFASPRTAAPWLPSALCDPAVLTCAANDFGFESIFSRQIEALGNSGDVFIALTTSATAPTSSAPSRPPNPAACSPSPSWARRRPTPQSLRHRIPDPVSHHRPHPGMPKTLYHALCEWIMNQSGLRMIRSANLT